MRSPAELSELSVWRIKHLGAVRTSATSDLVALVELSQSILFDFKCIVFKSGYILYLITPAIIKK